MQRSNLAPQRRARRFLWPTPLLLFVLTVITSFLSFAAHQQQQQPGITTTSSSWRHQAQAAIGGSKDDGLATSYVLDLITEAVSHATTYSAKQNVPTATTKGVPQEPAPLPTSELLDTYGSSSQTTSHTNKSSGSSSQSESSSSTVKSALPSRLAESPPVESVDAINTMESLLSDKFGISSMESDIAYLHHCNLSAVDPKVFEMIRNAMFESMIAQQTQTHRSNLVVTVPSNQTSHDQLISSTGVSATSSSKEWQHAVQQTKLGDTVNATDLWDDLSLQILELVARAMNACYFSLYQPTVPTTAVLAAVYDDKSKSDAEMTRTTFPQSKPTAFASIVNHFKSNSPPEDEARIVFCISVYDDLPQVRLYSYKRRECIVCRSELGSDVLLVAFSDAL
jgi:hypothetical protein